MSKIPVGATIAHGYGFLVRRIFTILGLSWITSIFYAAAAGFWLEKLSSAILIAPRSNTINIYQLGDLAGLAIVTALASAILGVALTHDATERANRGIAAYFVIAVKERRLFVARLEAYALGLIAILVAAIAWRAGVPAITSSLGARAWLGIPAETYAVSGICLVAILALATIAVRLDFFSSAQAVAEDRARLSRNWALSRGNFFRLLIARFFLVAPVLALFAAIALFTNQAAIGNASSALFSPAHDPSAIFQWISENAAGIAVAFSVGMVVLNALFAGASAAAYRNVSQSGLGAVEDVAPYLSDSERAFADYRPRSENIAVPPPRHEPEVVAAEARAIELPIPMPQFPLAAEEPQDGHVENMQAVEEMREPAVPAVEASSEDMHEAKIAHEPDNVVVAEAPVAIDAKASGIDELFQEAGPEPTNALLAEADVAEAQAAETHTAEAPLESEALSDDHLEAEMPHEPDHIAAAETTAEAVKQAEPLETAKEAAEITPPPSSSDVTESSPQSVPSEVV